MKWIIRNYENNNESNGNCHNKFRTLTVVIFEIIRMKMVVKSIAYEVITA